MPPSRPNILLMICHDLGQHIGSYGVDTVQTPNLDRLASQGFRLKNSFCTAPQCSPSRASLMYGRYPHSTGVLGLVHGGFAWEPHETEKHVASLLAEAGYRTHMFGIQHVTSRPERLGFHHRSSSADSRKIASEAVSFIENWNPDDGPFYAHVGFFEPHRPFDHGGVQPDLTNGVFVPPYLPENQASRSEFAQIQGAIHHIDGQIGRILDALDSQGLADDTIAIFTADHGIAFPRAKCSLYDPGIEVVLLIRWPAGGISGGRVLEEMVSNVDVLPTLLETIGVRPPANLQGRSFLPLLNSENYEPRDAIFAEKTYHTYYDPMRAVRTQCHKLIWNFDYAPQIELPSDILIGATAHSMLYEWPGYKEPVELYDLEADPWENDNLADSESHAEVRDDLTRRLLDWMRDTQDPLLDGSIPSPAYLTRIQMLRKAQERPQPGEPE